MNRIAILLGVALVSAFASTPAHADERTTSLVRLPNGLSLDDVLEGISGDGKVMFVETPIALAPEDTDAQFDVYALKGGTATLVSDRVQPSADGPSDAAFGFSSTDGSRVIFSTTEPILAADSDSSADLYEWTAAGTTLLSDRVQTGADAASPAQFQEASPAADRVIFRTVEPLVATDGDSAFDVYIRAGGETKLLSDRVQGGSDANVPATFGGASADLGVVAFATAEPLVAADDDATQPDVYTVATGQAGQPVAELASGRQTGGSPSSSLSSFRDISEDGSTVAMTTAERLVTDDGDFVTDVYLRAGGTTTLASDRRQAGADPEEGASSPVLNDDGSVVVFDSDDALLAADGDTSGDVYSFDGSNTLLLSDHVGPGADPEIDADAVSVDGKSGYFTTGEALVAADGDTAKDVYVGTGFAPQILTDAAAPGADDSEDSVPFGLRDGRLLFFTESPLLATDGDAVFDLYEVEGDTLRLVSTSPESGTGGAFPIGPGLVSDDGRAVFWATGEPLVAADGDTLVDFYVSVLAPPPPPPQQDPGGGGPGGPAPPGGGTTLTPPPRAPPAALADTLAPGLSALALNPKSVTVGKQATISFSLSEPARVKLAITRSEPGRRSGKKCVKPSRKNRRGKKCTRVVAAGSQTVNGNVGKNSAKTPKKLKTGAYQLTATATDAAGNSAKPRTAKFTVIKKKSKR